MLLKRELAMHDTLANRSQVTYEPLSEQQKYEVRQQVRAYLDAKSDDIDVSSPFFNWFLSSGRARGGPPGGIQEEAGNGKKMGIISAKIIVVPCVHCENKVR